MAWIYWRLFLTNWSILRIFPIFFMFLSFVENAIYDTDGMYLYTSTDRGPDSPSFVDTRQEVKVAQSDMAVIPCSVRNLGDRQVVWRRINDDQFLTIGAMAWTKDSRVIVDFDVDDYGTTSWDLLIKNVQFSDAGVYECQITSMEFLTRHVELKVFEPPTARARTTTRQTTTLPPTTMAKLPATGHHYLTSRQEMVTAGLPIRLVCNTSLGNTSLPRSSLEWFKDGYNVNPGRHVLLTRYQFETNRMYVSELLIDQSSVEDTGDYECRMENEQLFAAKILVLPKTQSRSRKDRPHYYARDVMKAAKADDNNGSSSCTSGNCVLVCLLLMLVWVLKSSAIHRCLCEVSYLREVNYLDGT